MKYRIIKEFDDNGPRHYELWLWKRGLFGYKWQPVQEQGFRVSYTKRFKGTIEIASYLNSLNVKREIIEESET
jgi:hypothetical protein